MHLAVLHRSLLRCTEHLQCAMQLTRVTSGDMVNSSPAIRWALSLEVMLDSLVAELAGTLAGRNGASALAPAQQAALTGSAARQALAALQLWATSGPHRLPAGQDMWAELASGASAVSAHLPLHRAAAVFLHSLLVMAQAGGEAAGPAAAELAVLLGPGGGLDWGALARHPLQVQVGGVLMFVLARACWCAVRAR